MNRRYYSLQIILVSPLSLSSGANENTDSDVLLDSRGKPYIPATSIAGVLASRLNKKDKERLYGKISPNGDAKKSHVIFYDAEYCESESCTSPSCVISVRDSVALEDKVGIDGAKFDFEIVEPGVCFKTYIELDDDLSENDEELLVRQLSALNSGLLRFGKKTTRGYGQVKLDDVKKISFIDPIEWLDFDMYDKSCWAKSEAVSLKDESDDTDTIRLKLKLKSALSIRSYTTELPKNTGKTAPDYKYLSLRNGAPVIPGTTWAGAFRERIAQLCNVSKMHDPDMKELFGTVDNENGKAQKSKITFSESIFANGSFEEKLITRNSIDRFSAATNNGALYTELTIYGGSTELTITLPKNTDKKYRSALLAAVADLHNGFMAIGGLTSVGRGLFEVDTLCFNGNDYTDKFKAYEFDSILGGEQD